MPDFDAAVRDLRYLFKQDLEKRQELAEVMNLALSPETKKDKVDHLNEELDKLAARIDRKIGELNTYPKQHERHFGQLKHFYQAADYQKSVYLMTKYPEGNDPADQQLQLVLDTISSEVENRGHTPLLASQK